MRARTGIDIFFELELCARAAKCAPPPYSHDRSLYSLLVLCPKYLLTSVPIVAYADLEDFIFPWQGEVYRK